MIAKLAAQKARGYFRMQVLEGDTKAVVHDTGFKRNLILDQGLDMIASLAWCDTFLVCVIGNGTTPTTDSGGASTVSQSGTTVSVDSGSFTFAVGDVGKLIRWDSGGQTAKILAYIGTDSVTVDTSATVSAGTFAMYRVNQTGLASEIKRTNSYVGGAGNCQTVVVSNTLQHRRTWDFAAEAGSATYRELGVSPYYASGNNLFSRILLDTPVSLLAGQILRVTYELHVTLTPTTPQSLTANIAGWPVLPAVDTNGVQQWQYVGMSSVGSGGTTTPYDIAGYCMEPAFGNGISFSVPNGSSTPPTTSTLTVAGAYIFLSNNNAAPAAFGTAVNRSTTRALGGSSLLGYTAGNFYRDKTYTYGLGEANRVDWRSMGIGPTDVTNLTNNNATQYSGFVFVFDDFQTKLNTYTLQLIWRFTWNRDLGV